MRIHILANAIEFPDDYRAVFTLPEKITAMLTTGMIETGEFHLNIVRRAAGIMQHAAGLGFAAVLGTPICKRERALDGGAVSELEISTVSGMLTIDTSSGSN